jgi:hypothetical protein
MLPANSSSALHCESLYRRWFAMLSIYHIPTDFMKQALLLIALLFLVAARGGRGVATSDPNINTAEHGSNFIQGFIIIRWAVYGNLR